MAIYNTILLAVDLHHEHDDLTTQRAVKIAQENESKLYVVHAFQEIHTYGATQGYDIIVKIEETLIKEAKKLLIDLSSQYKIDPSQLIFAKGSPKTVIIEQAKKIHADLIIVGSHGRHGISVLLGTTADGIIHHAPCDVLAVHVKE
jgi:universal stress protein A